MGIFEIIWPRENFKYPDRKGKTVLILALLFFVIILSLFSQRVSFPHFVPSSSFAQLKHLPLYCFLSLSRLFLAYMLSVIFSIIYGTLAARSLLLEKILIPVLDVLQSIPVLGFFPAAIYFFIKMGGEDRIAVEMACIFLIFTSQAWNMTFGVYESIKSIPRDIQEACSLFNIKGIMYFKHILLPACCVKLVYNSMMSWAAGWYFLIACEILAIGPIKYKLPGLGSFIVYATESGKTDLLVIAIVLLVLLVVIVDIVFFRPMVVISERFKFESSSSSEEVEESKVLDFARKGRQVFIDKLKGGSFQSAAKKINIQSVDYGTNPAFHNFKRKNTCLLQK